MFFILKTHGFVLTMMDSILTMMDFVQQIMDCILQNNELLLKHHGFRAQGFHRPHFPYLHPKEFADLCDFLLVSPFSMFSSDFHGFSIKN